LDVSVRGTCADPESGSRKQWTFAWTTICAFRYSYRGISFVFRLGRTAVASYI